MVSVLRPVVPRDRILKRALLARVAMIYFAAPTIVLSLAPIGSGGDPSKSASSYVMSGMQQFRENKVAESIHDFDEAARLEPSIAPELWQRGISDYYAGKFREGRRQFESHQSVNPDDVENAAWHFLCVARTDGIQAARKALIKIELTRDARVPMAEIYALFAGRGSEAAVLNAAKRADSERARMYAHLYLGLYDEIAGDAKNARTHIREAAAARLQGDYMHEVAKVHLLQRKWDR
jgi:lipoprotein NlpI